MEMPIIKLTNGLRVANFSSPHKFNFVDGSILEACTNEHAEKYKVNFNEVKTKQTINNIEINNISLSFSISDILRSGIKEVIENKNNYDIVLIPLSMLNALKEDPEFKNQLNDLPFRVIKNKNRIEKIVRISDFCL